MSTHSIVLSDEGLRWKQIFMGSFLNIVKLMSIKNTYKLLFL